MKDIAKNTDYQNPEVVRLLKKARESEGTGHFSNSNMND